MRKELPKKIRNAPQLQLGLQLYWDAFWDLDSCRSTGFGMGPIPWLVMRDYVLTFELSSDQQDELFYLVRMMDNAYREFHAPPEGKPSQRHATSTSSQSGWRSSRKP